MLRLKNFWPLLFILLCFNGFISCKSDGDGGENAYADSVNIDSSQVAGMDSASLESARISFQNVLDSVYQRAPKNVLSALLRGHDRYGKDSAFIYPSSEKIPDSLARKKPFLLLTDIDLPQSPDRIFDMRRSMFIQLSSPACLLNPKQIAVMEYAVQYSGTQVILVLANSNSRIIGAACDNVQTGSFASITSELSKAMITTQEFADRSSVNKDYVNHIAQNQANLAVIEILKQSPQLKTLSDNGKVIIRSAFYDGEKRSMVLLSPNASINTLTKN
jgi:carbonic anhydrase